MRDVNDFHSISINIVSSSRIKEWSYGEVKKPETINYRTLRPEKDGLFCERIFGTTKQYECYCGKYKGIRYDKVICEKCGVEVTHFKVRRERMGHIQLSTYVAGVLFYNNVPSRIGYLLDLTVKELRSVIYYEKYIITKTNEPDNVDISLKRIISFEEYDKLMSLYHDSFTAEIGSIAIKHLLEDLDLDQEENDLRDSMNESKYKSDVRLLKRLEIIRDFKKSESKPTWMITDVLVVISPELRPMLQLEGGRFATSDLNDLYRRVLNRSNRLARLKTLDPPNVIYFSECRLVQDACETLHDNQKRKKTIKGPGNRPLKSLSDMLKGKQGRFRQNLLGKRVDYSGRTVIVPDPQLLIFQIGLPKLMVLELFKPFIMRILIKNNICYNVKSAKKAIDSRKPEVWKVIDKVIRKHPVLINRAPTLHKLGIQAFEPVLVEDYAIHMHPLVTKAFNADFDGDQVAIHVPLSIAAQVEAWVLMLSSSNLLNPANGECIVAPTLDIIVGLYLLTKPLTIEVPSKDKLKYFSSFYEVKYALESDNILINEYIAYTSEEFKGKFYTTTPGRVLFNSVLPTCFEFINYTLKDHILHKILVNIITDYGAYKAIVILDKVKELGFKYATDFGLTLGFSDIRIPLDKQKIMSEGEEEVKKVEKSYRVGYLTKDERYNQVIDIWNKVNSLMTNNMMKELESSFGGFNPLFIMLDSGAKGSTQQMRQLASMRGLMAKPSGEILEFPIKSNFKEGLTSLEYFISTHGSRKGLADLALKTADAGYLTRRLIDVAQDVVINEYDCGSINAISYDILLDITDSGSLEDRLNFNIIGAYLADDIISYTNPYTDEHEIIFSKEKPLDSSTLVKLLGMGFDKVDIRTVLTCESVRGVCVKCYGKSLTTGKQVEIGEAVGIISAQSIGQPGTQLTMRTFHVGGTAVHTQQKQSISYPYDVIFEEFHASTLEKQVEPNVKYTSVRRGKLIIRRVFESYSSKDIKKLNYKDGDLVSINSLIGYNRKTNDPIITTHNGVLRVYKDDEANTKDFMIVSKSVTHVSIKSGTKVYYDKGSIIHKGKILADFDPFFEPLIAEQNGYIKYKDIVLGTTLKVIKSVNTLVEERIIIEPRDLTFDPAILLLNDSGELIHTIDVPEGSHLICREGELVEAGTTVAKITSKQVKTYDITGGLPRIAELFEARKLKDSCVLSSVSGTVRFGKRYTSKKTVEVVRTVRVSNTGNKSQEEETKEISVKHFVPVNKTLTVREGDVVSIGDKLCEGAVDLDDIMLIKGVEELQSYLLEEIQGVYRVQGVTIYDKHISVIIRQMLQKVEVIDTGDTEFIINQKVDKLLFYDVNNSVLKEGGKPAVARPIILGMTKASLNIDSFISAASFQETTKVLTTSAIKGKVDYLRGLKENVIIGHLIPAGTGCYYNK